LHRTGGSGCTSFVSVGGDVHNSLEPPESGISLPRVSSSSTALSVAPAFFHGVLPQLRAGVPFRVGSPQQQATGAAWTARVQRSDQFQGKGDPTATSCPMWPIDDLERASFPDG